MNSQDLTSRIKSWAADLGFDRCGVARAGPTPRTEYLRAWLEAGRGGTMEYLRRTVDDRSDPSRLLPGARSIIVVALSYHQRPPLPTEGTTPDENQYRDCQGADASNPLPQPHGKVAMYAWGEDYHVVVREKLTALLDRLRDALTEPFAAKVCVDTAPLVEREWAAQAGIGWIGKNTLVLDDQLGSYFFLGAIVTTLELEPDEPVADHCGTCTACLEACPTSAFPAAYQMDAPRCISYLTIEHRANIPAEFHEKMGNWVFGCDVCQEVCPFNRRASLTREPRFAIRPPGAEPLLNEILSWTPEDYRAQLKGSAMKRAKLGMLHRNAAITRKNARCFLRNESSQ